MGDLDQSIHGYINTSVDTLTVEMDRQFGEVRQEIQGLRAEVGILQEGVNAILNHLGINLPVERLVQ